MIYQQLFERTEAESPVRAGVIGTGQYGVAELTEEGGAYLRQRGIEVEVTTTPRAIEAYNRCAKRKAALIHVTC